MSTGGEVGALPVVAPGETVADAGPGVPVMDARPRAADPYEDLRARIDTVKAEVDGLQIELGSQARPWKRLEVLVPILVSVAALVFTIVSSASADERIARQDEHAARAELRGLIQRLNALPKERFEINRVYVDDEPARNYLNGQVTGESILLAHQAAEIIDQLEGEVGAQEYIATAFALTEGGQWTRAEALLIRGLDFATDALNEATLLRQLGSGRFNAGDIEGGRSAYGQALKVFEEYPDPNTAFVATTQAYTESFWAQSEVARGNCEEAWTHLTEAETVAADLTTSGAAWIQLRTARSQIEAACGPQTG